MPQRLGLFGNWSYPNVLQTLFKREKDSGEFAKKDNDMMNKADGPKRSVKAFSFVVKQKLDCF
jgi:hypothetical protein